MNKTGLHSGVLLSNAFQQAWMAVLAFRLRCFFGILAVSLGRAALAVIVASMEGANRKIDELVSNFGPDAAFVSGGSVISRAVGQRSKSITWRDVNTMRDSLPGVYITAPMSFKGQSQVVYENHNFQVNRVMGSTENYAQIWNWPLDVGRDISTEDLSRGADVCLVGAAVARELFGEGNAIGKTVLISRVPFTIIGKLSVRGSSGGGDSMDETVIIPLSTMIQRFNQDRQYLRMVRLKFLDAQNMDMHADNIRTLLRYLHGLDESTPDDFTIITALDIQRFISMIKGGMFIFLGITAFAAVCVSGFVLANLFYISVSERCVEVGLKKALGAPRASITAQFLCEAVLLTLGGSLAGVLWGSLFSMALTNTLFSIELSWTVFLYSVAAAVLIGVVFGLKPAHRAAGLEPISALKGTGDNG
jgi:putative ABC transport system permease protein